MRFEVMTEVLITGNFLLLVVILWLLLSPEFRVTELIICT